jgi:hypothetical protein
VWWPRDEPALAGEQRMCFCDLAIGRELRVRRRFAGRERVGNASSMRTIFMDGIDLERSVVGFTNLRIWERQRDGDRFSERHDYAADA